MRSAPKSLPQAQLDRLVGLFNAGRHQELEAQSRTLIQRYPNSGFVWKTLSLALYSQGKDALPALRKAAELLPDDAEAHSNLGAVLKYLGHLDGAVASFRQALRIRPDDAAISFNLAVALNELGQFDESVRYLHRVLAINPGSSEACLCLGNGLLGLGQLDQAVASYRRALEINPDYSEAHGNLGKALLDLGLLDEAEASCRRAVEIKPDYAEAYINLGNVLKAREQTDEAVSCYRRALDFQPNSAVAHNNLGIALAELKQWDKAVVSCRRALEIKPDYADAHCNLCNVLVNLGQYSQALASCRRSLQINPNHAVAHQYLGNALLNLERFDEALSSFIRAQEIVADSAEVRGNLLFLRNYSAAQTTPILLAEARRFGEMAAQKGHPYRDWGNVRDVDRCLRIGFVSGDFGKHPVGYFMESVLAALKTNAANRLELMAYPSFLREDEVAERLKSLCHGWRPVVDLSDESLAQQIYEDCIDILIDLSGHTGHNRLLMFARKPAPVQLTWLGYFASTGLAAMDYLLADPWTAPSGEEEHFTETIWRMPESYLCFTAPIFELQVGPLPSLASGVITFGCFNNLAKMNDAVLALWARVMRAVPDSRLFLKTGQLDDANMRQSVTQRFAVHGIDAARLILEGASPREELLAAYNQIDIALDPFPYPGGTTSAEALWMGVPVLTLAGDRFLSHIGESILQNAGLPDWIAADADDYVARAVRHAGNISGLAALRDGLRQQVLASPLFDAPRFAHHFETALRGMWAHWCQQQQEKKS